MEVLGIAACTARPLVFGSALLRGACILCEQAVTAPSASCALPNIEFCFLARRLCAGKQAFSSMPNAGSAHKPELATNHCGRALAAKGRTARTDADTNFVALARPFVARPTWPVHAFGCRPLKAR